MTHTFPTGRTITLVQGDITTVPADAIVNAANSHLAGGGGVDGAIHRVGGPSLMAELDQIRARQGGCPTGNAVATTAGNLPAHWVFHAVGPIYRGHEDDPRLLAAAYRACLGLAMDHQARTLTFPSLSTGAYGYPVDAAARIAIQTVAGWLNDRQAYPELATFVLFDQHTLQAYERALQRRLAN